MSGQHENTTGEPVSKSSMVSNAGSGSGFGRIGVTIRETIIAALDPIFPKSGQGAMTVLWAEGAVKESAPFRYGTSAIRDFWNIPDVELIGLVRELSEQGMHPEQLFLQMIKDIGLGRVTEGIRGRLAEIVGRCSRETRVS